MECSSLVVQEEENAYGNSAEDEKQENKNEDIGFPEETEKVYDMIEDCPEPKGKVDKEMKEKKICVPLTPSPPTPHPSLSSFDCSEKRYPTTPIYETEWNITCRKRSSKIRFF